MNSETKKLLWTGGIIVAALIAGYFLFGAGPASTGDGTKISDSILIRPESHQSRVAGPYSYKVNIVEFGDYQCPGCAALHTVMKQILQDYKGQVNLIFRNYPIPGHINEEAATLAAEAGGRQDKFWQMHDLIYENQKAWSALPDASSYFATGAQTLGLDMTKYAADIADPAIKKVIATDTADADSIGVTGTPTLFINGVRFEITSFQGLRDKINSMLNGTQPQ